MNVAFVIDRSGSMAGSRIAQAREAAIMAVNRLEPNDIASVVIFDDKIDVLVPAQKVTDRKFFTDRILQVGARGSTAIYAGVTEGASEVRKNKDARRLNRVVLLSDGLANVGPRNAEDFAKLGRDLLNEGISVSTIGLGKDYNEDLMLQLASAGDGNHAFAAAPDDLIKIFNKEFDDVLASCAQTVSIDVDLQPGARVVRAISRDGDITPAHAKFQLNQIYQETEHYILLEVELDGKAAAAERDFGRVRVAYTVPDTGAKQTLDTRIRGRFSASAQEVKAQHGPDGDGIRGRADHARARAKGGQVARPGQARRSDQAVQGECRRHQGVCGQRREFLAGIGRICRPSTTRMRAGLRRRRRRSGTSIASSSARST